MPFTFSHPAIVLPLAKMLGKRVSATGLIIGSMSPDFEYFIKMRMERIHGHTFSGLFYFDLPLTLILAVLFHLLVRDALITHLPELLKKRLINYIGLNWFAWLKKRWYVLIYSALIGILSHVFWDAFTHTDGFFVLRIPFLQGTINIFGVILYKAAFAQTISTFFGALFILIYLVWPLKREVSTSLLTHKIVYWTLITAITTIILLIRNVQDMGDFIATFISGGLIALVVAPLIMKPFYSEKI